MWIKSAKQNFNQAGAARVIYFLTEEKCKKVKFDPQFLLSFR